MESKSRSTGVRGNSKGSASASTARTRTVTPLPLNTSKPTKPMPHQGSKSRRTGQTLPPSSNRPCREHSFLTDVADVRQMEQGLLKLLDDFHSGKLQAFGEDCTFEKMDQVREQQEHLARLHFELDSHQEMRGLDSAEAKEAASKNLGKLMDNLQELCTSIQNLQKGDHPHTQQNHHYS